MFACVTQLAGDQKQDDQPGLTGVQLAFQPLISHTTS